MSTQGALALNDLLLQDIATLREINVEGCGLGDDGMSELSRGLRKNRTLIKLNLNNNNIGIGGTFNIDSSHSQRILNSMTGFQEQELSVRHSAKTKHLNVLLCVEIT